MMSWVCPREVLSLQSSHSFMSVIYVMNQTSHAITFTILIHRLIADM